MKSGWILSHSNGKHLLSWHAEDDNIRPIPDAAEAAPLLQDTKTCKQQPALTGLHTWSGLPPIRPLTITKRRYDETLRMCAATMRWGCGISARDVLTRLKAICAKPLKHCSSAIPIPTMENRSTMRHSLKYRGKYDGLMTSSINPHGTLHGRMQAGLRADIVDAGQAGRCAL